MNDDDDYKVGYGKPPKQHQFKKGVSGNPRGRPRKDHSQAGVLARFARQRIPISRDGKRELVTPLEAMLNVCLQQSLKHGRVSDLKHYKALLTASAFEPGPPSRTVQEEAEAVVKKLFDTFDKTIDVVIPGLPKK